MKPRAAPKCGGCGNHPRSKLHVEQCGAKIVPEPAAEFVVGSTCITCNTTYTVTPFPGFQLKDTKHGKYDVTRQLPLTAEKYPICYRCLPGHWRIEARRHGMEKEVRDEYGWCYESKAG